MTGFRSRGSGPGRVVYPVEAIRRSKQRKVDKAVKILNEYARPKRNYDFPHVIVFDWNGTVDARNTGVGIPLGALVALKKMGKEVVVYTSSVNRPGKSHMREVCREYGIPFTGKAKVLDRADMFVADKSSDERRAGRHGVKFVWVDDFDMSKVLAQKARDVQRGAREAVKVDVGLPADERLVAEVRAYNREYKSPASVADIATELNTRGRDLEFQGKLDRVAHQNEDEVRRGLDRLVEAGKLAKFRGGYVNPGGFFSREERGRRLREGAHRGKCYLCAKSKLLGRTGFCADCRAEMGRGDN